MFGLPDTTARAFLFGVRPKEANVFSPMLAHSAPATDETITRLQGTHHFDLKIDGVRCLIAINKGTVKLTNRNGVDISYRFPEVVQAALTKFGPDAMLILDGEVAGTDERGMPSFKRTAKRDRQQRPAIIAALAVSMPVRFFAFDILYRDGVDHRRLPWSQRSMWLDEVLAAGENLPTIQRVVGSPDGAAMMALVRQHKLEGLVAKLSTSPYESGRRSSWVKIKPVISGSFLVTGTTEGSGTRKDTFGALSLAVTLPDGKLLPVGEVGSGFKQADLLDVLAVMMTSGVDLIVEVEYAEYTVDGSLRFPVFKMIRSDLTRADASVLQLGEPCAASPLSSEASSTSTSQSSSTSTQETASA